MKQMTMILTAFAVTAMMFIGACDCATKPKTQYEIKYVDSRFPPTDSRVRGGLPLTDKIDEGTLYTTKTNFTYNGTNGKNLIGIIEIGRDQYDIFDLGYKKFTVNSSVTIYVRDHEPQGLDNNDSFLWVTYVLDMGKLLNTCENYDFWSLPFKPQELVMHSREGSSYRVTEWKDNKGNKYTKDSTITRAMYPGRGVLVLYSSKTEPVSGKVLTYHVNGATSGTPPVAEAYDTGKSVTIVGNTGALKKTGYIFMGWNTKFNGTGTTYTAGQSLTLNDDITLYAKWGKSVYVNFDPNGAASGTAPGGIVSGNSTLVMPGNTGSLAKTGFTFGGWNTKKDGTGTTYADGSTLLLLNNMTFFAKWNAAVAAGNGITVTAVNAISGTTISSSCKLYWFITTDKYMANPAAVVTSGNFSSASETKNVDLPAGTYYVWGFIDKDNSGTKSAGDYGAVTMINVEGTEVSDIISMKMYRESFLLACAVTSSSGYIPAKINFPANTTTLYEIPASEAVITVGFQYTGSKTVSDNNCIREYVKLTANNFDSNIGDFHGYLLTSSASTDTVTIRCAVGTPLYFAASMDAAGTHSGSGSLYPTYTTGDPFIKYSNRGFAETADAYTPAAANTVYGVILTFDDTKTVP